MTKPLENCVCAVTGAGRGIGAAIAFKLAALGAETVLCGRTPATLEETAAKITAAGGKSSIFQCDVTDLNSVEAVAREVQHRFGRMDVLVNNAGVGAFKQPLHKMSAAEWDDVLNTNLRGVFYCIRAFVPIMIAGNRGGHVINISSLAGKNALPNGAAYAASKWGLNGLSYSVAEELRGYDIRVSTVCPGSVDTELSPHEGKSKSKMLRPEDVAHAVEMIVTQAPQSFMSEILLRPTQKP